MQAPEPGIEKERCGCLIDEPNRRKNQNGSNQHSNERQSDFHPGHLLTSAFCLSSKSCRRRNRNGPSNPHRDSRSPIETSLMLFWSAALVLSSAALDVASPPRTTYPAL